jgi:hypothetical protein
MNTPYNGTSAYKATSARGDFRRTGRFRGSSFRSLQVLAADAARRHLAAYCSILAKLLRGPGPAFAVKL